MALCLTPQLFGKEGVEARGVVCTEFGAGNSSVCVCVWGGGEVNECMLRVEVIRLRDVAP